jgi:hypothetical protein
MKFVPAVLAGVFGKAAACVARGILVDAGLALFVQTHLASALTIHILAAAVAAVLMRLIPVPAPLLVLVSEGNLAGTITNRANSVFHLVLLNS